MNRRGKQSAGNEEFKFGSALINCVEAKRFWEVDSLRGIAITLMVASNAVTDLRLLGVWKLVQGDFWWWFARAVATAFVFLVGISLVLSFDRIKAAGGKPAFEKFLKRGARVFSWGLLITAGTWFFIPHFTIVFGILHFIGVAVILAWLFIKQGPRLNAVAGLIAIALGFWFRSFRVDFPWLLWVGLIPQEFYTADYFPLIPWFGVVLIGIAFGKRLYTNYKRNFSLPDFSQKIGIKVLAFLGKHSLFIYMVHQPVLLAGFWLAGVIELPWI